MLICGWGFTTTLLLRRLDEWVNRQINKSYKIRENSQSLNSEIYSCNTPVLSGSPGAARTTSPQPINTQMLGHPPLMLTLCAHLSLTFTPHVVFLALPTCIFNSISRGLLFTEECLGSHFQDSVYFCSLNLLLFISAASNRKLLKLLFHMPRMKYVFVTRIWKNECRILRMKHEAALCIYTMTRCLLNKLTNLASITAQSRRKEAVNSLMKRTLHSYSKIDDF